MGPGCLVLPHTMPRLWPRPQTSEEPFQGPCSTSQVTLPRNPYRPNAAYQAHKGRVQHVHQDLYEHGLVLRHKLITLLGKQQGGSRWAQAECGALAVLFYQNSWPCQPSGPRASLPARVTHLPPPAHVLFPLVAPLKPTEHL